ncbi:MAG TPA: CGNR zinc finger domain-containing protein, partial [Kribbellaceae bacterium]|nr:CGNR zinc finger domain-containing protein [Kribbellaceae bacterium]
RLATVQRFVNTRVHDFGIDRLGTAAKARVWLRSTGLLAPEAPLDEAEAARLRRVREGLRALAVANREGDLDPSAPAELAREGETAIVRVRLGDDAATSLAPASSGSDAAVATLLVIVHEAQLTGTWPRLKACRHCTYAFFDRSKNRSAAWCAMSICGNRTKNRAYRQRRRPG